MRKRLHYYYGNNFLTCIKQQCKNMYFCHRNNKRRKQVPQNDNEKG